MTVVSEAEIGTLSLTKGLCAVSNSKRLHGGGSLVGSKNAM